MATVDSALHRGIRGVETSHQWFGNIVDWLLFNETFGKSLLNKQRKSWPDLRNLHLKCDS